jgi:hypothetical protein
MSQDSRTSPDRQHERPATRLADSTTAYRHGDWLAPPAIDRSRSMRNAIMIVVLSAVAGCAPTITSRGTESRPVSASPSMRELVTFDELRGTQRGDLFSALTLIRPRFLDPGRGTGRLGRPARVDVFVNGTYFGDVDVLRGLLPEQVASVRFVRRSQAFVTLGPQLRGEAALFVTLLR